MVEVESGRFVRFTLNLIYLSIFRRLTFRQFNDHCNKYANFFQVFVSKLIFYIFSTLEPWIQKKTSGGIIFGEWNRIFRSMVGLEQIGCHNCTVLQGICIVIYYLI